MKYLISNLSISKKYTIFLFGVISILLFASYLITSKLIRESMQELFTQRLMYCESTFSQYSNVHFVTKASEIEAVVTSPRFVAAVATADYQTIANEVPYYKNILGASLFVVADVSGGFVYGFETNIQEPLDSHIKKQIQNIFAKQDSEIQAHYILHDEELYELFEAEIITQDGLFVGHLIAGTVVSKFLTEDLKRLTGFDIVVSYNDLVVAQSNTSLTNDFINLPIPYSYTQLKSTAVQSLNLNGTDALFITESDERLNVSVTFIGYPNQQITPILVNVRSYLIGLAFFGGILALIVIYYYTSRRIGRQIDTLVKATNSISNGNLDFELLQSSKDEFGELTSAVDKMRKNLKLNIQEISKLHEEKIHSERLASLGKSATGIIHDFKSPMTVIRGTIELLSMQYAKNEALVKKLQMIIQEVDRMNQLAQDVIEFSQGKFNLSIKSVELQEYFTNICDAQQNSFDNVGVGLIIETSQNYAVKLDSARFRRVIDNILNNAREALKPGQQVCVFWEVVDDELLLQIIDNGPGIPEKIRDNIFEAFVTSGKKTGTGLGLAIAKKIVEDHNATINVMSDIKSGTKFIIKFPSTMINKIQSSEKLRTEMSV